MRNMDELETTTDCIRAALDLKEEAKTITTRESHAMWWDDKVDLLKGVNHALETGYFTGEAYEELRMAKTLIYQAEKIAGEKALAYYYQNK